MTPEQNSAWDHSNHDAFVHYYEDAHLSDAAVKRLTSVRDIVLARLGRTGQTLDVLDIGCGPGAQSFLWAELGHRVLGLDVSEQFIALAKNRARPSAYTIDFQVASAANLPCPSESIDICVAIELLEHVVEWERCLDEFTRVLRPGGALFITTTNTLCPKQQEFDLPFYSWYPGFLKRRYERLAKTTRPELASFATYPAVNWFTFYGLQRELSRRGCRSEDRFTIANIQNKPGLKRASFHLVRALPPLRLLAHIATPSTWILAIKKGSPTSST